jgi:hypothetical protein
MKKSVIGDACSKHDEDDKCMSNQILTRNIGKELTARKNKKYIKNNNKMENSVDYFTRLRAAKLYSIQLWYY